MNEWGTTVVHAPSDSGLQITAPAKTTMNSYDTNFLDISTNEEFDLDDNDDIDELLSKHSVDKYYQFLK